MTRTQSRVRAIYVTRLVQILCSRLCVNYCNFKNAINTDNVDILTT